MQCIIKAARVGFASAMRVAESSHLISQEQQLFSYIFLYIRLSEFHGVFILYA
jgi:hypothetical protein